MWVNQHDFQDPLSTPPACKNNVNSKYNYNLITIGYPDFLQFAVDYRTVILKALKKFSFSVWIVEWQYEKS